MLRIYFTVKLSIYEIKYIIYATYNIQYNTHYILYCIYGGLSTSYRNSISYQLYIDCTTFDSDENPNIKIFWECFFCEVRRTKVTASCPPDHYAVRKDPGTAP